jgi:N-acetylglucosamine-6-phosphate deacetylase
MTEPYAMVGEVLTTTGPTRAAVVIQDGKIDALLRDPRSGDLPEERREFVGLLCPGFIDLQINGAFGADIGPDPDAIKTLVTRLPTTGVTSFLPTLISSPTERYEEFFDALEEGAVENGARVLGAHLEGPFLAPDRKGAHDPAYLRPIDLGFLRELLRSGKVRIMTLAPELPNSLEAIELLLEEGAVASAGHTDATCEEVTRAVDAGLSLGTHLYNAMRPLAHREPGTVGALLTDDRVKVGIIADGVHVHEAALRLAHRAKGSEGLILVTDAMQAAGMPPGDYELGRRKVHLEDGAVRLPDGTLAGSALTMDEAVRNAVRFLGISPAKAVRMAAETPAAALNLDGKGQIAVGCDADFVLLDAEGTVLETIVAGETLYEWENEHPRSSYGGDAALGKQGSWPACDDPPIETRR